jgi:MmyB-like transcription regulator ligand binding domain
MAEGIAAELHFAHYPSREGIGGQSCPKPAASSSAPSSAAPCTPAASNDPARPGNLARFNFLDSRARDFYLDWDAAADTSVALLHTEADRDPYDRGLTDLVGELSTRSECSAPAGPPTTSDCTAPVSSTSATPPSDSSTPHLRRHRDSHRPRPATPPGSFGALSRRDAVLAISRGVAASSGRTTRCAW